MIQLKPVYSKHVEDLIVQLEDMITERKEELWELHKTRDRFTKEYHLQKDIFTHSCKKEIQRIKDTQLPMFYELV